MFSLLSALFKPLQEAIDWIRKAIFSSWSWILSIFVILLSPLQWFFESVAYYLGYISEKLQQIAEITSGFWDNLLAAYSNITPYLALANGLFPLTHLFVALSVLFGLWVLAIIYRAIKSYVPTIS